MSCTCWKSQNTEELRDQGGSLGVCYLIHKEFGVITFKVLPLSSRAEGITCATLSTLIQIN